MGFWNNLGKIVGDMRKDMAADQKAYMARERKEGKKNKKRGKRGKQSKTYL
jgi:Sec-independent protein translocase protein TatA